MVSAYSSSGPVSSTLSAIEEHPDDKDWSNEVPPHLPTAARLGAQSYSLDRKYGRLQTVPATQPCPNGGTVYTNYEIPDYCKYTSVFSLSIIPQMTSFPQHFP